MTPSVFGQLACVLVLLSPPEPTRGADLAASAQAVLKSHCYRCHGQDGVAKGGFGYVLDREQLVTRHKVVPGKAAESELFQRVHQGEMPPAGQKQRPTPAEVATLRQWIDAGAPAVVAAKGPRPFLAPADVQRLILADLQGIDTRHHRFIRYLTLTHLYNAGRPDDELETCRQGVSKLINSLSWHPRITVPKTIDAAQSILRLDLRDYKWTARNWDRLVAVYPYRFSDNRDAPSNQVLRADWFVATASRPPLYQDLLQLPTSDRELERQLRVDVLANIQEESVARAGFNGSGVSQNNRLLERHDASYGAYWRSYDFSDNTGRQNLFERPLGPTPGQNSFVHAGGEIIFNLPNGLQAYLLVDGNGRRVDRAPVEIVSDPKRPDRVVETGVSCMSCHVRGIIPKADQVRAHVEKNTQAFSSSDVETIKALHVPEARMKALMEEDSERFVKALKRAGVAVDNAEQVATTTLRYEAVVDLAAAAAEFGLRADDFSRRLRQVPTLARTLGALQARGGTVQRQTLLTAFPEVVREFRLTDNQSPLASGPVGVLDKAAVPFAGHTDKVLCLAFAPDGKLALSGSEDRTVRLWDLASGKELRRFEGHTGAVLAVAFSADGSRILSGGQDRTVRLWDVANGKEPRRLTGHTDAVRCLAFSPDGRRLLSGSADQTVRLWEADSGKELTTLSGHRGRVHCVAFSPDGSQILSAGSDRFVYLWDAGNGRLLRRLEGHGREVFSVAFSPDGNRALSGGEDRTVRLWDVKTGQELRRLEGHVNAVLGVAFSPDGRQALSGSSQYQALDKTLRIWDLESGKEQYSYGGKEGDGVNCLAFSPDGRQALVASFEPTLRLWQLAK